MTEVYKDNNGYVRTVQLYLGCSDPTKLISRVLVRPIDKIVLLLDSDKEVLTPDRGAMKTFSSFKMRNRRERSQLLKNKATILGAIIDLKVALNFCNIFL